ncbi:MAG: OmpP1/FadL family transporter, partial [Thermoguttaceae bacterium]
MRKAILSFSICAVYTFILFSETCFAQGVMLRGVGAINESMGGAATACPLDSAGAINWNPASISGLKQNEMSFGLGLILPETSVSSTVGATTGYTKGEAGVVPVPTMSMVWRRTPQSRTTIGLGMGGVGGAASLYPKDITNPVLSQHAKSANVVVLQVTPTISYKLTEKLSVGVAPLLDLASLNINPMQLGQSAVMPNSEVYNYGTRYSWGAGFQTGVYYDFQNHFKTGFMFKSPIWAEAITIEGMNAASNQVSDSFQLNLPMTLSWGVSYDGIRNTVLALDVRYLDYANTSGFDVGLVGSGANTKVGGLDWDSVISVAMGAERTLSEKVKVRMGYCWNQNPIPPRSAQLNIAAPLMIEHALSFGATYTFAKNFDLLASYTHAFESSVTGPIPGGTVTNSVSANLF